MTVCWSCGKTGHRAYECPNGKGVSNVCEEEENPEYEAGEEELEAGGVFWLNSVDGTCRNMGCQKMDNCQDCTKSGWKVPRKTVRPNASWIIHGQEGPKEQRTSRTNRFAALQEADDILKELQEKRQEKVIQSVTNRKIPGKSTIDSGAADSVIPKDALEGVFPMMPKKEGVNFVAANGQRIRNYGRMNVASNATVRRGVNRMTFHVAGVQKPLASVSKMVEQGTSVHFTPGGSYIEGVNGERIELKQEGGVYVMDVKYLQGFSGQA